MQNGVKVREREVREAQRAAEFERFQAERLRPVHEVAGLDRFAIELEAAQLINAHQPKESILPPQEYANNARTALFEALTASGHLSVVELAGDEPDLVNQQVLERLLNGYSADLPMHEQRRRFMEICEELTVQKVQALVEQGRLPLDTEVLTISDFPETLDDDEAKALGYRASNKKGMVRTHGFARQDGRVVRRIEQVARSNASPEQSGLFLTQFGAAVKAGFSPDVDLLGTQTLFRRRHFVDGVVDIQRRLDEFAGDNMRFGDEPDKHTPEYQSLRQVSRYREAKLEDFVRELAEWEETLDKQALNDQISSQESTEKYMHKVRELVRRICVLDPRYTKDALGEKSVPAIEKAAALYASGDVAGAADVVAANASNENAITICGMSIAPEELSASEREEFKKAFAKQRYKRQLRPKHSNDRFYLVEKYNKQDVKSGTCIACGKARFVARCSICPECDFKDTERPGYVEGLLRRQNRGPSLVDMVDNWIETLKTAPSAQKIGAQAVASRFTQVPRKQLTINSVLAKPSNKRQEYELAA